MKFTYTCKKVSLNDSVKAYAEKKVGKLEKFFKEEPRGFCHLLRREEEPLCRRDHAPWRQRHAVPRGM